MSLAKVFSIMCMLPTFFCFAQEADLSIEESVLEEVIINEDFCVKGYTEDRIYLNEDKIYLLENGIHLLLNDQGDYVQLSKLESDRFGCYLSDLGLLNEGTLSKRNPKIFNDCPDCGRSYFIKCNKSDCPGNMAKAEKKRQEENNRKNKDKPKK